MLLEFTLDELLRIKELYLANAPLTFIEIADIINAEFHKYKSVRDEDSICRALDLIDTEDG
jgi:hypothetical protein